MGDIGYVFIPGGGMSGWVWKDLDAGILDRSVLVRGRLSANTLRARMNASLDACVDHVVEEMLRGTCDGNIIVAHSGGGIIAPLVAKRMPASIKGIIFVSANIPRNHTNAIHILPLPLQLLNMFAARNRLKADSTPARAHEKIIRRAFCNTSTEEVIGYVLRQELLTEPLCVFFEKVDWTGMPAMPMAFIRLLADRTTSVQLQDRMAANLGIQEKYDIESDHMVMLSHPARFNEALLTLSRRLLG
jgi:pimeloyl-ACP methyl ester carboxylesterase